MAFLKRNDGDKALRSRSTKLAKLVNETRLYERKRGKNGRAMNGTRDKGRQKWVESIERDDGIMPNTRRVPYKPVSTHG
jgi:hypothetical protein